MACLPHRGEWHKVPGEFQKVLGLSTKIQKTTVLSLRSGRAPTFFPEESRQRLARGSAPLNPGSISTRLVNASRSTAVRPESENGRGCCYFSACALLYGNRRAQRPRRGLSSAVVPVSFLVWEKLVEDSKGTKAVPLAPSLALSSRRRKARLPCTARGL